MPAPLPFETEMLQAQPLAAELLPAAALPVTASAMTAASLRLVAIDPAERLADDDGDTRAEAPARTVASSEETVCLAKAIRHEAGGQARDGQLAVAQLIVNRRDSGRFANSVCGVVNQQGQFFRTADYHPDTGSTSWLLALAVAQDALAGDTPSVAPGALFFHSAYQAPKGFFRSRQRVAMLGGNVFYR